MTLFAGCLLIRLHGPNCVWLMEHVRFLKIYETEKVFASHEMNIGDIRTDMKTYFQVAVKDGFINVLTLQLAGKKRMNVADFLRGYRTSDNNKVE